MEWRIMENSNGGFIVERGNMHDGGVLGPSGIGRTLPAFIVYEMSNFDTRRQAESYIARRQKEENRWKSN